MNMKEEPEAGEFGVGVGTVIPRDVEFKNGGNAILPRFLIPSMELRF